MKRANTILFLLLSSVTAVSLAHVLIPVQAAQLTYVNNQYHFKLTYPKGLSVERKFTSYYHVPGSSWRYPMPGETNIGSGEQVMAIPVISLKNNPYYPDYFSVIFRIGASNDPVAIKNCITGSDKIREINHIKFHVFSINSTGMSQYAKGASYRTIYNNTCFAVETIKTGAGRMEAPDARDIPEAVLNKYYEQAKVVMNTFKFTG